MRRWPIQLQAISILSFITWNDQEAASTARFLGGCTASDLGEATTWCGGVRLLTSLEPSGRTGKQPAGWKRHQLIVCELPWQQGSAHRSSIQITTARLIAENQPRASTSSKAIRLSARRGAFTFCAKVLGDKGTFSQPTYRDLRCRAGNDAGNLDSGTSLAACTLV